MTAPRSPTTLLEFTRLFPDDEACAEYLFLARWPDGFVCPKCGSRKPWVIEARAVIECERGHQTSLTAGTILHGTRTPLHVWFWGAFLMSTLTPGISALQFGKQLGIRNYETAFQMLHKLRAGLVAPAREKLRGEVEIDEAYVGGPEEGRPGRGAVTKVLIVCAVEVVRWKGKPTGGHTPRTTREGRPEADDAGEADRMRAGRVRLRVIPDAGAETLVPWVVENVEANSIVYTDGHAGYNPLTGLGYQHARILATHKRQKTGLYLPLVNLVISNLKRWLLGTHKGAVSARHLQAYLNEFTFRFNRRFWRGPAFHRALGLAAEAAHGHPTYAQLYGGEWAHPNPLEDE